MPDPFITKLNERHLCSWYVLPLLGLNVEMFGLSNFINAYQITQSYFIAVQVVDMHLCLDVCKNPFYRQSIIKDNTDYLIFFVPNNWRPDYKLFLLGKYTKMSEEAKQKIRELSGLKYEVPDQHGNKLTDAILMALENHYVLRRKWAEVLGMYENDLPEELLSTPISSSFITLNL